MGKSILFCLFFHFHHSKLKIIIFKFHLHQTGTKMTDLYFSGEIPPHGKASITAEITPTRSGTKTLIVDIDTAEQKDFKGSADIYVGYSF